MSALWRLVLATQNARSGAGNDVIQVAQAADHIGGYLKSYVHNAW